MGKLFWVIQMGPKYNDMYPYKREAEGDCTHTWVGGNEEDKGGVKTELGIGALQAQAKKSHELPEDRR